MPRFMSGVVRKNVEISADAEAQRLESTGPESDDVLDDVVKLSYGDLFWEFIADELLKEDDEQVKGDGGI